MRASTSVDLNLIQEGIHGVLFASDGSHPLRWNMCVTLS